MNCGNCNAPLIPGNPVCPNCGTTNDLSSIQPINDEAMIDLDEDETAQVTADMAPPTLDVNSEDLTQNVRDLGSGDNSSTYDPNYDENENKGHEVHEDLDGDGIPEYSTNDSVNIAIPSVTKPVDVIEMPNDGSAPSVDLNMPTLGNIESDSVKQFKIGGKTIKIKMGKKRNVPQVILIGGVVIFFIIGIMVGSTVFKQNVCVSGGNKKITNTEDLHFVADGQNNITKAGKYTFKIPTEYKYDKLDSGVIIYDTKGTWRIYIKASPGSYDNMASAKVSIEESLKTESINVVSIKESKIGDKNHLIIETSKNLVNRLMAFVNAGNDHVFYIEIVNVDNNFNYDILEVADDIINNVEFDQKESYVETIPTNDITDMAVNAAEAYKSLNNKSIDIE